MIPLRLQMKNFMNHVNSDIDCTVFSSALIVAKNKANDRESNGIGKTTVYSAIEYALFGKVPTSVLNEIVRDGAEKCQVIFDFQIGDKTYRILRGRSIKNTSELRLWIWTNGDWVSISERSMPETTAEIQKIIKISHKSFIHSIKYAQDDVAGKDWTSDSTDRQNILKEPLNLSPYTKLEKIANKKRLDIEKNIEKINTSIQMLGDPEAEIKTAETEWNFCKTLILTKEAEITKYKIIIDEKKHSLNDLKKSVTSSDSDTHDKIAELQKRSETIEATIIKDNKIINQNQFTLNDSQKNISEQSIKLKEQIKKKELLDSKNLRSKDVVQIELKKVSSDELYGTGLLAQFKAEYDAANKRILNGDFCSYCYQSITPEHRQKCEEEVNKILEEKSKDIKDTEKNLKKCIQKKKALDLELSILATHESELNNINNEITRLTSHIELYTKNSVEATDRLNEARKELENSQSEYEEVLKRLSDLKEAVQKSSLDNTNQKIIALNDEIHVFENNLENVRHEIAEARLRFGGAEEKIRICKDNLQKLKDLKTELNNNYESLDLWQAVVNGFSYGGIPTFIILSILDELQIEVNKLLQALRPELELTFDKDINMTVKVHGRQRDPSQLSKGQHVYILLSLKMGLAKVIQRKIGVDIRFLLLDEVDQPLDKAGVDAFADVIKKWQSEFKTFIITHNDALKDKFSHAILVEGDGVNGASARVVSSW